ncbi:MAG: hypothetical protein P1Q69_15435 [Candidatus Thorarchaeota archaeon]|nr:hypothetical protein [Candidatus Thorarchaeota archaeon]
MQKEKGAQHCAGEGKSLYGNHMITIALSRPSPVPLAIPKNREIS